jgi:hypothetical protein
LLLFVSLLAAALALGMGVCLPVAVVGLFTFGAMMMRIGETKK